MGNKYSKEFKEEAVRMCKRDGVRATGEKLGVSVKALCTHGSGRSAWSAEKVPRRD